MICYNKDVVFWVMDVSGIRSCNIKDCRIRCV